MSVLTLLLFIILLIILLEKKNFVREMFSLRDDQVAHDVDSLNTEVDMIRNNLDTENRITQEQDKTTKELNEDYCKNNAIFYDYNTLEKSYDRGLILKPKKVVGKPIYPESTNTIDNTSHCEPIVFIKDYETMSCTNTGTECVDISMNNISPTGGNNAEIDGEHVCRYPECANKCDIVTNNCFEPTNSGLLVDRKHFDKCIYPIDNKCTIVENNHLFNSNVVNLCPNQMYYNVINSNYDIEEVYKDKSVDKVGIGQYQCEYNYRSNDNPNKRFDSMDDIKSLCSLDSLPAPHLLCYSSINNNEYLLSNTYPLDLLYCEYNPQGTCYVSYSNDSNISMCDFNNFTASDNSCSQSIECTKTYYTLDSSNHTGDVYSATYNKHTIQGSFKPFVDTSNNVIRVCTFNEKPEDFPNNIVNSNNICVADCPVNDILQERTGVLTEDPSTGKITCTITGCDSPEEVVRKKKFTRRTEALERLNNLHLRTVSRITDLTKRGEKLQEIRNELSIQRANLEQQERQTESNIANINSQTSSFRDIDNQIIREQDSIERFDNFSPLSF